MSEEDPKYKTKEECEAAGKQWVEVKAGKRGGTKQPYARCPAGEASCPTPTIPVSKRGEPGKPIEFKPAKPFAYCKTGTPGGVPEERKVLPKTREGELSSLFLMPPSKERKGTHLPYDDDEACAKAGIVGSEIAKETESGYPSYVQVSGMFGIFERRNKRKMPVQAEQAEECRQIALHAYDPEHPPATETVFVDEEGNPIIVSDERKAVIDEKLPELRKQAINDMKKKKKEIFGTEA
jgi:hypothetical protein